MSGERFTLDTNILIYSIDNHAGLRQQIARRVIDLALERDCRLTLQAVSEFYAARYPQGPHGLSGRRSASRGLAGSELGG